MMLRKMDHILFIFLVLFQSAFVSSFYDERQKVVYYSALLNFCKVNADGEPDCKPSGVLSGRYGQDSPKDDVEGDLYIPKRKDGCQPFEFHVKRVRRWVAMVSNVDNCTYKQKILNALNHNASAVIIYSVGEINGAIPHPGTGNIVVVTTKIDLEKKLGALVNSANSTVRVIIKKGEKVEKYVDSQTSILFVSVSFVVLMVISLAWLVFYYVQRFRYHHARDKTEKRLTSAAKKAIAKLPNRTVKKGETDENESCAVCLETYEPDDILRIMPCKHEFHKTCVDPWLVEHRTCPMCKLNILQELGLLKPEDVTMDMETIVEDSPATFHNTSDDHNSAADNHAAEYEEDGSRDGSVEEGGSVLQVSAELNWERDRDSARSTTSLVQTGTMA